MRTFSPSGAVLLAALASLALVAAELVLPPLPYPYEALEPYIDRETMKVHHTKHHQAYTDKANAALKGLSSDPSVPSDLKQAAAQALRTGDVAPVLSLLEAGNTEEAQSPAVGNLRRNLRNQGGGFVNHNEYFFMMSPNGGGEPTAHVTATLSRHFGSVQSFKQKFASEALDVFGSGWVFLTMDDEQVLRVECTSNQDRPRSGRPILSLDVWEHGAFAMAWVAGTLTRRACVCVCARAHLAMYLKYQNRRAEYIDAWWKVVDWTQVDRKLRMASENGQAQEL
jgi:Fe-Mn family superoxide dismutase